MVYSYNGMSYWNEKHQTTDRHNSTDESQTCNVMRKKPDPKGYILFAFIYVNFQNRKTNLW